MVGMDRLWRTIVELEQANARLQARVDELEKPDVVDPSA